MQTDTIESSRSKTSHTGKTRTTAKKSSDVKGDVAKTQGERKSGETTGVETAIREKLYNNNM